MIQAGQQRVNGGARSWKILAEPLAILNTAVNKDGSWRLSFRPERFHSNRLDDWRHGQCSRRIRRSFCRAAGLPKSLKSARGRPGPGNYLSKDMKGFAAFWPEAKYGKMRIEGRDPVNA
jgi:hypothetical protein